MLDYGSLGYRYFFRLIRALERIDGLIRSCDDYQHIPRNKCQNNGDDFVKLLY